MPATIFREYIMKLNYFPEEIINGNTQYFDFILGFASEKGTGKFVHTWNVADLSPQEVLKVKGKHPNVRMVISIGSEFKPTVEKGKWIATAVSSIKAIIQEYHNNIDGIDIHYDDIKSDDFANYIGDVIERLKNDPELSITVVSIAPTQNVQAHYRTLYSENRDKINWVDYRFYDQKFSSTDDFTQFYKDEVVHAYTAGKVLAGVSNLQDLNIYERIKQLIKNNSMPGAFVWNADKSKTVEPAPFPREKELQNL